MATDAVTIPSARAGVTPPVATRARRLPRVTRRRLATLAAVIVGIVLVGGILFLRSWPPLATVMSASMAPAIKTGDVVLLQHLDRPAHVGDIIEVNVPDEARSRYGYPPVVIHRIVSISATGQIQTKGDARRAKDPFTVSRRAVTARVVATVPAAGRIFAFLLSPLGLLWLVGGAVLLFGMPLLESRREQQERERQSVGELQSELRAISADLAELRELARRREVELVAPPVEVVAEPEPELEPEPVPEPEPVSEPEPGPEPDHPAAADLRHLVEDLLVADVPEWDPYRGTTPLREAMARPARPVEDVPDEWVLWAPVAEEPAEPAGYDADEAAMARRRTGGLVGSVERYARSLSSRYR